MESIYEPCQRLWTTVGNICIIKPFLLWEMVKPKKGNAVDIETRFTAGITNILKLFFVAATMLMLGDTST
jgi:hypothetical protein